MPENPSPFDDPFADLYGKLPDPRERTGSSAAPTSRRAAREARRGDTAPTPVSEPIPARQSEPRSAAMPAADEPRRATAQATQTRPAATGTLEDLFAGDRTTDELGSVPSKKERRRRRTGGWIAFGIIVVLLGGIAGGGLWAWNTYGPRIQEWMAGTTLDDFAAGQAHDEARVTISSGDTGTQVSQKMFDAGVTKTATSLYDYMIEESVVFTFQPGVYRLQLEMTSPAVLEALANPDNRLQNTVQLREGLTVESSVPLIAEQMGMPVEDVQAAVADPAAYGVAAQSLEGWLFPATYEFDDGVTATQVIQTLVNRTIQSLDSAGVPEADRERILTVASIIEREGRTPDFPKVSRVIQNRIDQGMQLQMDSTAQYGYGELHAGSVSTSDAAQLDDNPWNTYVIYGLPVTPIANPGDAAIAAAMNPEPGPWLYFVTVNLDTGETLFSETYEEHQRGVAQWQSWCRDNPDSGC